MKNYLEINRQAYDSTAEEYKKRKKEYEETDKEVIKPFIDYLKSNFSKINVLELGPGSGLDLHFFSEEGFNTTAIDISQRIINISKESSPKTKYIHADFLDYDFGRLKYDGIFAKAFIHLFPKKDSIVVIKKMRDLLTPRGVIFIGTTLHENPEEGLIKKLGYPGEPERFRKKWTEQELLEIINPLLLNIISKGYNFEEDKNKKWIRLILNKKEIE